MLKPRRLSGGQAPGAAPVLRQLMPQAAPSLSTNRPAGHIGLLLGFRHIGDPRPLSRWGADGPRPLGHSAVRERRALRDTRDVRHQPRRQVWLELFGQFEAVGCEILRRRAG